MHRLINFGLIESVVLAFACVNLFTFALFAYDKWRAKNERRRISEAALIFFALCGGAGAVAGMYVFRHKTRKRRFWVAAIIGVAILCVPAVHILHGLTLDRVIRFVEIEHRAENWPRELNGYRIAFMADFHIIPHETMAEIVAEINARDVDLLLLGGDFTHRNEHYLGTLRELSRATARDGIFGVDGNHDEHTRLFEAMRRHEITPLDNDGIHIRDGFFLAGVHDLWNRFPCVETAIADARADDFVLLISHNPDVTMQQSTEGADLILAGHTHGGQITFFGFAFYLFRGSITDYDTRFARGFTYSAEGTPVFTTVGVGELYTVPRVFARPEVVIFTMNALE